MKHKILYIGLLLISFAASSQKSLDALLRISNAETIPYISVDELRMYQLNDSVVILDAREREEFDVSHIPSARYVGYDHFSSEEISEEIIDKDTPIIVYCSLGIRSEDVGEELEKVGFTNVKNLYGGIFEWKNKIYPVIDSEGKETENVHTFSKHWSRWLTKGVKVYR